MIISVCSPRRGLGQTITCINIAETVSKLTQKRTLVIDTDKNFSDVEYYLGNTGVAKGLDDYCSLYRSNLLSDGRFSICSKNVNEMIDIMSANRCYELSKDEIATLCKYIGNAYSNSLIDLATTATGYFEASDKIIVLLNQAAGTINRFLALAQFFEPVKDRIVFVINNYTKKIDYGKSRIKRDLKKAGFNNEIFTLSFEPWLANDINKGNIFNYPVNGKRDQGSYFQEIENLACYILDFKRDDKSEKVKRNWLGFINNIINNRLIVRHEKTNY
jgi:MinD-like ATPase involved in chromosome partitioning or flagellar assembly